MRRTKQPRLVSAIRSLATVAALLTAMVLAAPGTALASHDKPTQICNNEYVGSFSSIANLPLYRNGPGTTRLGYLSVNAQWQDNRSKYRVCAVTVRRWHGTAQYTNVHVTRAGAFTRDDPGNFYRYAGPVVGGMKAGQSMSGGGQIRDACARFTVTWARGGRPEINGGGC